MLSSFAIGFERKLAHQQNQLFQSTLRTSKIVDTTMQSKLGTALQDIQTLDEKAKMASPIKTLGLYEKKGPEI